MVAFRKPMRFLSTWDLRNLFSLHLHNCSVGRAWISTFYTEACLFLLCFALQCFTDTVFFTNWRFLTIISCLCHIWVVLTILTFVLLLFGYGNLWSVIFNITTAIHWRLRWWVACFSNNVFFFFDFPNALFFSTLQSD